MTIEAQPVLTEPIVYPESDGQPMADNTKQFRWIVTIQGGLDALYGDTPDIFVAGDLLWYPVEGTPSIRRAPDVLVVFGRPKGDRGAYLQWQEAGIAPQVVFEVLSPGNTLVEMGHKFEFYDLYGVEEYYLYDPDHNDLTGWLRRGARLRLIDPIDGWISPRMAIRFLLTTNSLEIYRPDGRRFLTFIELQQQAEQERAAREQAQQQAEQERAAREQAQQQVEQERAAREQAQQQVERLAARLRALGVDPDA
jgi:Uma2 family endonuclease